VNRPLIHPHTTLKVIDSRIGHGVVASTDIPMGTITYAYDALDIIIPPGDPRLTDHLYQEIIYKYGVIEADGSFSICWDIAKYLNHCCHYNTLSTGFGFDIATRDIAAGEEITQDYGAFNMDDPLVLECHYADCRLKIYANDFDIMAEQWDRDIQRALRSFQSVSQPLLAYLGDEILLGLFKYLDTGEGYKSINLLRYNP
jgi:hypothetical protein